ncbi:hypothetical protein [Cellulomonas denverensis]|uniref:Uncharacterized protein n=1 Tax=Cellulomonas denverensis TaxID=264297 RepID=A0A7X6KU44_9CELL|nr:hypothetical protein [Cellulomonas denverensis]NKY22341.1 hypothetical protein [Cellulomonas denverensis]
MDWGRTWMAPWRARRGARSLPLAVAGSALLALSLAQVAVPFSQRLIVQMVIPPAAAVVQWVVSVRRPPVPAGSPGEGYAGLAVFTALACLLFPLTILYAGPVAPVAFGLLVVALRGRDVVLLIAAGALALAAWPFRQLIWASAPLRGTDLPGIGAQAIGGLVLILVALRCRRDERRLATEPDDAEDPRPGPDDAQASVTRSR